MEPLDLARDIAATLEDKKAEQIVLLDLRPDSVVADYFVICTGTSDRQLKALVDYVRQVGKEKYNRLPYSTEGPPESGWVLMDYGNVVVHLFTAAQRRYYDLEGRWNTAQVLLTIQ